MFLYLGSFIITLWGIVHLFHTRNIPKESGEPALDNRRIFTTEWVLQGLVPVVIGVGVFAAAMLGGQENATCSLVAKLAAGVLAVMAVVGLSTRNRFSTQPDWLFPAVNVLAAVLFLLGSSSG